MSSKIEVRPLEPSDRGDADRVADEAIATLRETYRPGPAAVASRRSIDSDLQVLVAERGGEIVGAVEWRLAERSLAFLTLAVARAHRRTGVARALVEGLARLAREAGKPALTAATIRETGNVPVFRRLGFRVVREEVTGAYESDTHGTLHDVALERPV